MSAMRDENLQKWQKIGFSSREEDPWVLLFGLNQAATEPKKKGRGRKSQGKSTSPEPGKMLSFGPWQLTRAAFKITEQRHKIERLSLSLSLSHVQKRLEKALRHYCGPQAQACVILQEEGWIEVVAEIYQHYQKQNSSLRLVDEPLSLPSPASLIGCRIHLNATGSQLSFGVSHFFYVGQEHLHVLQRFWDILLDGFGLSQKKVLLPGVWEQVHDLDHWLSRFFAEHLAQEGFTPRSGEGVFGDGAVWQHHGWAMQIDTPQQTLTLDFDSERQERRFVAHLPMEILEQRELARELQSVDAAMIRGDSIKAYRELKKQLETHEKSLPIARRAAYMELLGRGIMPPTVWRTASDMEPRHPLFLSLAWKKALKNEEFLLCDRILQELSGQLDQRFARADAKQLIMRFMSEYVGDCAFSFNQARADRAYLVAIEERGKEPRLIIKAMALARKRQDALLEKALGQSLLKLQIRKTLLRDTYARLAELKKSLNEDDYLQTMVKAWQLDPGHVMHAKTLATYYLEKHDPQAALAVLMESLTYCTERKDPLPEADLHLSIGLIWHDVLQRKEMAQARFVEAIKRAHLERSFLQRLPELLPKPLDPVVEALRLETLFDLGLRQGQEDEVRRILPNLLHVYGQLETSYDKSLKLYESLVQKFALTVSDVQKLLGWQQVSIDWHRFYESLDANKPKTSNSAQLAEYEIVLADITWQKLKDRHRTAGHLKRALELGTLAPRYFDFLRQYLLERGENQTLTLLLQMRIDTLFGKERAKLIQELLAFPNTLQEEESDVFACELWSLDGKQREPLLRRMAYYGSREHVRGILQVLHRIKENAQDPRDMVFWYESAFDILRSLYNPDADAAIEHLAAAYLDVAEPDPGLRFVISLLWDRKLEASLIPYVLQLIQRGQMPDLLVHDLLRLTESDPWCHGLVAEHVAHGQDEPKLALQWLRKSLVSFAQVPTGQAKCERILLRIGMIAVFSSAESQHLESLIAASENWPAYEKVLLNQRDLAQGSDNEVAILNRLLYIYKEQLPASNRALAMYQEIYRLSGKSLEVMFETVKYAIAATPATDAKRYAWPLLERLDAWQYADELSPILHWLVSECGDGPTVKGKMSPIIEQLMKKGKEDQAEIIIETLSEFGVTAKRWYWLLFERGVMRKDAAAMQDAWNGFLGLVTDVPQFNELVTQVNLVNARNESPLKSHQLIENCLKQSSAGAWVMGVASEMKIYLGLYYFEEEKEVERAAQLLHDEWMNDPEDKRLWMPLYFLHRKQGDRGRLTQLLATIIPQLEKDGSPLRNYPVTLEKLRADMNGVLDDKEVKEKEPKGELKASKSSTNSYQPKARIFDGAEANSGTMPFAAPVTDDEKNGSAAIPQIVSADGLPRLPDGSEAKVNPEVPALPPISLETKASSMMPQSQATTHMQKQEEVLVDDWRSVVALKQRMSGMTRGLLNTAFAQEIEKHMALQCFALLSGEYSVLEDWQTRIWRKPEEATYPFEYQTRLPAATVSPLLRSPLMQAVQAFVPLFVKLFEHEFSLVKLAKRAGIPPQEIINRRKPMTWAEDFFKHCGLSRYREDYNRHRFVPFSMPGIGADVFFDGRYRTIYFDASVYRERPISHLHHAISLTLRSVKVGYFVPLSLDPVNTVLPIIRRMQFEVKRLGRRIYAISPQERDPFLRALLGLDIDKMVRSCSKLVPPQPDHMRALWVAMRLHILKLEISETLDLFGIVEHLASVDLLAKDAPPPEEIWRRAPVALSLVDFAAMLIF